ncbi:14816_t:CDS:1, partial [Gigaspora margarita]
MSSSQQNSMINEKNVKDIFASYYKENNEKTDPELLSFLNFLKYYEKQQLLNSSYRTILFK